MEILSVNAHQKLANIVSSIGRAPLSWHGWNALHISVNTENENLQHECLFWTKSILDSYVQGVKGTVYFCDGDGIHIICKNISTDILQQMGQQICSLVYSESSVQADYNVYNLSAQGQEYEKKALNFNDHIFSIPVSEFHDNEDQLVRSKLEMQTPDGSKPIMNSAEFTKVLLVEDDPVTRWMVRNALKHQCHLATAPTGNKAFSLYTSFQPDIVFLDINLPDKNGYEILEWILRNDPGACVVMFSSNDHLDNIANALSDGAAGFIAKPFLKENLLHYVHNYAGTG